MKRIKKLSVMLLCCLLLSVIAMPVSASAAKLNKKSISLNVGKTYTLKASGTKGKITWTSSKKSVATVSSKGVVKAKKKGTAVITAKYGKKKLTCKVTVKQPVTSVKLNKTSATLKKGESLTLKATVSPSSANNKTVTWTSSNKKVATVSSKGVVKAVGNGTATITVKTKDGSGKKTTCKITVKTNNIENKQLITDLHFVFDNHTIFLESTYPIIDNTNEFEFFYPFVDEVRPYLGTVKFSPTIVPSNATNQSLSWKSSNTQIATVDDEGRITAIKAGSCTITASAKDGSQKTASFKLTVMGGKENFMIVDMSKKENVEKYIRETNRLWVQDIYDSWTNEKVGELTHYFKYENPIYSLGWRCIGKSRDFAILFEDGGAYSGGLPYFLTKDMAKSNIEKIRGKMIFYNIRGGNICNTAIESEKYYLANPY